MCCINMTFLSWGLNLSEPSGQNFKAGLMKLFPEHELKITAGERHGGQSRMGEGHGALL